MLKWDKNVLFEMKGFRSFYCYSSMSSIAGFSYFCTDMSVSWVVLQSSYGNGLLTLKLFLFTYALQRPYICKRVFSLPLSLPLAQLCHVDVDDTFPALNQTASKFKRVFLKKKSFDCLILIWHVPERILVPLTDLINDWLHAFLQWTLAFVLKLEK